MTVFAVGGKGKKMSDIEKLADILYCSPTLDTFEGDFESYKDAAAYLISKGVAVPVRCKDCRAYLPPTESRDWGICRRHTTPMRDNNFCNYGEKEV